MNKVKLLNVWIDNLSKAEFLEQIKQGVVFTPNVDQLMKLQNDKQFLSAYNSANYILCDSQILMCAAKFLGTPLKEKVSGSDFFPAFYDYHKDDNNITIFTLAGKLL